METNFFSQWANLAVTGRIKMVLSIENSKLMTITLVYTPFKLNDDTIAKIKDLTFSGPPKDIDAVFFADITKVYPQVQQVYTNIHSYKQSIEKANQNVNAKSGKKDSAYDNALKEAAKLAVQGNYRRAYSTLPKVKDYPQHKTELETLAKQYAGQFGGLLFNDSDGSKAVSSPCKDNEEAKNDPVHGRSEEPAEPNDPDEEEQEADDPEEEESDEEGDEQE